MWRLGYLSISTLMVTCGIIVMLRGKATLYGNQLTGAEAVGFGFFLIAIGVVGYVVDLKNLLFKEQDGISSRKSNEGS